jgi:metal-dependent hydrolase (beta-lactamase superfamily II)
MFRSRATKQADGSFRPMEDVPSIAALEANGGKVVCTRTAQTIAGNTVFVSGEIPRVSGFETGLPGQHRRTEDGKGWELDEVLMDERFIAMNVRDKGLVVLTACSHAGVVNVLTHARACFPDAKLHTVLGGLHLSGINERVIPQTVKALHGFDLEVIAAGHCTGWRAMSALNGAFGDEKLTPLAVGKRLKLGSLLVPQAQLQRDLIVGDLVVSNAAANVDHLEPFEVAQRARRHGDRRFDGIGHRFVGAADDFALHVRPVGSHLFLPFVLRSPLGAINLPL